MAPLTLLVGENSTGKTSFLAILRALWEVAVNEVVPDFRREPYDLGAFSEIVYNDSSRGEQPDAFQAGFRDSGSGDSSETVSFRFTFQDVDGVTHFQSSRYASVGETSFDDLRSTGSELESLGLESKDRSWKVGHTAADPNQTPDAVNGCILLILRYGTPSALRLASTDRRIRSEMQPEQYEERSLDKDNNNVECIREAQRQLGAWRFDHVVLFAGAPARSKPRRTYDPSRLIPDPEGEYVPSYLASMSRQDTDEWNDLKNSLEKFGRNSGLFDEISVDSFGRDRMTLTPFQIQIRKFGGKAQGQTQELNRCRIWRQPDTADHHRAISAGDTRRQCSCFSSPRYTCTRARRPPSEACSAPSLDPDRQLVVETHSDYIIDRVRMDVRDNKTDLKPEDVSILYFERGESDVKIHSIRLDADGNVLDAPEGYRQFFADELTRSIGL